MGQLLKLFAGRRQEKPLFPLLTFLLWEALLTSIGSCSTLVGFQVPEPCPADGEMAPEQTPTWSLLSCLFMYSYI